MSAALKIYWNWAGIMGCFIFLFGVSRGVEEILLMPLFVYGCLSKVNELSAVNN